MRCPPMIVGATTRFAPARRSFDSACSSAARATMWSFGFKSRAVNTTYTLSASSGRQVARPLAYSTPASRSVSSSVASRGRTVIPRSISASTFAWSFSTTRKFPFAARRLRIKCDPTRPAPQMIKWLRICLIFRE